MQHLIRQARRATAAAAFAAVLCLQATPALAAKSDEDEEALPDARLTGYDAKVNVEGGTMLTYMLLAFLGVLAVGVTFKSAGRSHLD